MIQTDFEQGSPEWLLARLGRASASMFGDILASPRSGSGESASRRNYRATLVLERVTGGPQEHYKNEHMDWGSETEDLARTAYMLATGNDMRQVGFAQHSTLMAGASPDGLIGLDGGGEIKCKSSANHLEGLKLGHMPMKHKPQVQGNLWIYEREWWDYISFDPRFPENSQLLIDRIYRDDEYIEQLEHEVIRFLNEVGEDTQFVLEYNPNRKHESANVLTELFNGGF